MRDLSKPVRKAILDLAALAYERELSTELSKLRVKFDAWERGETDAFELERAIHAFHNGAARELFNRYSSESMQDHVVAHAVIGGVILESEVPEIARDHISGLVAIFRSS